MACSSCGSKARKRVEYEVTYPDGRTRTYGSEIEAKMATSRHGGTYRSKAKQ